MERYIIYEVHSHIINKYAKATRLNYLTPIYRFYEFCKITGRHPLAYPHHEVISIVQELIDALMRSNGYKDPAGSLYHFRGGIGKLMMCQLGIPAHKRAPTLNHVQPQSLWTNLLAYVNKKACYERSCSEAPPMSSLNPSKTTIKVEEAKVLYYNMMTFPPRTCS